VAKWLRRACQSSLFFALSLLPFVRRFSPSLHAIPRAPRINSNFTVRNAYDDLTWRDTLYLEFHLSDNATVTEGEREEERERERERNESWKTWYLRVFSSLHRVSPLFNTWDFWSVIFSRIMCSHDEYELNNWIHETAQQARKICVMQQWNYFV